MQNNTVVTAFSGSYLWGVFLLLASMRRSGMDEPVLVFTGNLPQKDAELLQSFGNVQIVRAPDSPFNMTCRKAEAMLCADTEFITWADCDAFFSGNCSPVLAPDETAELRVRLRSPEENGRLFGELRTPSENPNCIPQAMLDVWKRDVKGREEPRFATCVSACYLSIRASRRDFLERWDRQMKTVLPASDAGVFDSALGAYKQLDESVLNSLLCFLPDAPRVTQEYLLNLPPAPYYLHMIGRPKPWEGWTPDRMKRHDLVMKIVQWTLDQKLVRAEDLPWPLNPRYSFFHQIAAPAVAFQSRASRAWRKLLKK